MTTRDFKSMGVRIVGLAACLSTGVWLTNCDDLDVETVPTDTPIESIQRAVVVSPQNSGIFDLKSMVATTGNRRIAITTPPALGKLQSLGNDLLKYSPNEGIKNGRDKFFFSVFSSNNVEEQRDSIIVIISQDSTALPCDLGVRVTNDFITNVAGAIEINVLANDTACHVSRANLIVAIPTDLKIEGVPVPPSYHGSLSVLPNGNIRYTPGSTFQGTDKFIYRVEKPANLPQSGDYATSGYGFVYLTKGFSCKDSLRLANDLFQFKLDSISATDSLYLNTAGNDFICTQAQNDFAFSIKEFPLGALTYGQNYGFMYRIPPGATAGSNDRFSYKVCVDDVCKEAEVTIEFK